MADHAGWREDAGLFDIIARVASPGDPDAADAISTGLKAQYLADQFKSGGFLARRFEQLGAGTDSQEGLIAEHHRGRGRPPHCEYREQETADGGVEMEFVLTNPVPDCLECEAIRRHGGHRTKISKDEVDRLRGGARE